MGKLPLSINKHIFRFLTHPAADAIRNRISEYQAFSSKYGSSAFAHRLHILLIGQEGKRFPENAR